MYGCLYMYIICVYIYIKVALIMLQLNQLKMVFHCVLTYSCKKRKKERSQKIQVLLNYLYY